MRTSGGAVLGRSLVTLLLCEASTLGLLLASAPPATAATPDPCSTEQQIFVRDADIINAHGDSGTVDAHYRDLNFNCETVGTSIGVSPNAHDAIHLGWYQNVFDFVEAGYVEWWDPAVPSSGGHVTFNTFGEAQFGTTRYGPWLGVLLKNCYGEPNGDCGSLGLRVEHRVTSTSSGWDFEEKIIWAGGSWDSIKPNGSLLKVGFDQGVPMGETSRRGGDGTGMSSDWKNLNERGASATGWTYWDYPQYWDSDNVFNYHSSTPPNWHPCTYYGSPNYPYPKLTDRSLTKHHYYIQKDTTPTPGSGCPG
jgi:hypothetical protein